MLDGATIRLRPWQDSDLPVLTSLRNDVSLQAQLLARARGSRPEQVREWLETGSSQTDRLLFIIADRQDDQPLGFIQVSDLDLVDGHANLGICLLSQARSRGLGGQAITLLADYLHKQWRLRKIYLRVRSDNTAAIRCYEKAGFERCGLLRQHVFVEGQWHDVVLMECFIGVGVD